MAKPMNLDDYVGVTKWAFSGLITKQLDAMMIAACPALATPGVRLFMDQAIGFIVGKVMSQAEVGAFFMYTDLRVNPQGRAFVEAAEKNHEVLQDGSPEEKQAAQDELMARFVELARITT